MQVLEGPYNEVSNVFEKIRRDPRHTNVCILSVEDIHIRQFSEWGMAFFNLDNPSVKDERGFSEFLQDEFTADVYRNLPYRAYMMLVTFKENIE